MEVKGVKGVKGVKDECLANSFHFETPNELEDRTRLDGIVFNFSASRASGNFFNFFNSPPSNKQVELTKVYHFIALRVMNPSKYVQCGS